jgi:hypothetical protein
MPHPSAKGWAAFVLQDRDEIYESVFPYTEKDINSQISVRFLPKPAWPVCHHEETPGKPRSREHLQND